MDIVREGAKRSKNIRRAIYGGIVLILIPIVTVGLSRLKPAAPSVDVATVWTGTVERGSMLREVRGLGTLVPETIRIIPSMTDGRVEQRLMLPGRPVSSNSVILVLSNPTLEQATVDADFAVKGAEADYNNLKAVLQNQLMDLRAKAAVVRSNFHQAQIQAETNEELFKLGLTSDVILRTSKVSKEELEKQNEIAEKQVDTFAASIEAQTAAQAAKVEQARAVAKLKHEQLNELKVTPGIDGVLQELDVEVGQQVAPGTMLARVAQPTHLKAQLKIAETQAKDVVIGQKATIDTHNGIINGHVTRIDPSVVNGTVTVDTSLEGALPSGARPDLSVEGTVEIERLTDVLYVGRPVHGEADSTVGLFKLNQDGKEASRVQVKLGRTSVNTVEIVQGLKIGDKVVLSDMSAWDNFDRIRLN